MDAAAGYLVNACGMNGRFIYRIDLDADVTPQPKYNILRHAGAMYALESFHRRWPNPDVAATLGRASRYLQAQMGPVEDGKVAVWSTDDANEAKLGAAGLALIALTNLPGTSPERLAELANFVAFMQKPDGSFYSKYFKGDGPDDSWTSLYYPGEAALGLVVLQAKHPRQWDRVAASALGYLARSRAGAESVPPDHWSLIATRDLLLHGHVEVGQQHALRQHARQVCKAILAGHTVHPEGSQLHGSFGGDGRTTPTATRLEGLLAALSFLDEEQDAELRRRIRTVVDEGIVFLLRAQRLEKPYHGAIPRSVVSSHRRATEVRIDYVQHALSAWIDYYELL
jgi:hypothetical protein